MKRVWACMATLGLLGLGGCLSSSDDDSDLLRECRGGADAEAHVEIVVDYDQSIHEMVACGGLNVTLVSSVTVGIVDAIIDNRSDATPSDWAFQGDGVYYTNGGGAEMTTRFYANTDFSFAASGDVLTENLFLVDSYLVGARVEANIDISDPFSSSVELIFDDVGPYVELLGYGENPTSPIALDTSAWDRVKASLGSLDFDSDITVDDTQSVSTVRYDVKTGRMPASSLLSGAGMGYELQMASATREDLGQSIIVEDWGIEFVDANPGALNGTIEFRVEGDAFDYLGSLTFENDTYGTPEYRCE
ncbi:MAG: hypothetical protein ACRBN8_26010 [Nannocystales bacterium]